VSVLRQDLSIFQYAHIYEIKSARTNRARQILGKFTSKQQTAIYFGLGIGGLNDPRNVLFLCGTCNKHFDDKNIAIQPGSYELLISPRIFLKPFAPVDDIPTYQELNKRNKRVEFVFVVAVPGDKLLERRLRKFQRKQATPDFQDYVSSSASEKDSKSKKGKKKRALDDSPQAEKNPR
jgi:hypothetical protein